MVNDLLFDFGISGVLLFTAYMLRRKVRLFQRFLIPAPIIAGIIGILLGPYVLGAVSPIHIQYSEYIGQTTLPLMCCVLCSQLFLVKFDKSVLKQTLRSLVLMSIMLFVQVLIGIALVRVIMPGANDAYGLLPFTSFHCGAGICTIVTGAVGDKANFSVEVGNAIGNAYATISMVSGVILGMAAINIARKKGILASKSVVEASEEEYTGFVPEDKRVPAGMDVTNSQSLNTMTLHFAISAIILFVGMIIFKLIPQIPHLLIPCTFSGLVVGLIFKAMKWDRMVDMKSFKHFGSIALEFLMTSVIATTNIHVFASHGKLIVATSLTIIVVNLIVMFGLGKLWNGKHWFENTIGLYGTVNGVAATGLTLAKAADPYDDSGAMAALSSAIAFIGVVAQMPFQTVIPLYMTDYGTQVFIGVAIALVVYLIIGFLLMSKKTA